MKVLVACEFSGRVRDAFIALGHEAVSCDILPTDSPGPHIQQDVREIDLSSYDLKIGHPPCTYLCVSGNRWRREREREQREAIAFFMWFVENGFNCIENPIGIMSSIYKKPSQIIHPWQFGHRESKTTCLWLNGVPNLIPTEIVEAGIYPAIHYAPPSVNRSKLRSVTYRGIAEAMAKQWS